MANQSDSFIDEVSEEVRRDRLYALLRRWGWLAALLVVAIVAGTAWQQYRSAEARAQAEALGDAVLAAVDAPDSAARIEALQAVPAGGEARAVRALLVAAEQQIAGDPAGAVETLEAVATDGDVPLLFRDLAALKSAMIEVEGRDAAARRAILEDLAQPGAPFALLASEQLALLDIEANDEEAARARLAAIAADAQASQALRERAQGLIVALGPEVGQDEDPAGAAEAAAATE